MLCPVHSPGALLPPAACRAQRVVRRACIRKLSRLAQLTGERGNAQRWAAGAWQQRAVACGFCEGLGRDKLYNCTTLREGR